MMGPFEWEVVKVTTSGQAWLRAPHLESLVCRPSSSCTVVNAIEPAGPAEVPLMDVDE
jgi:hypothetical protein